MGRYAKRKVKRRSKGGPCVPAERSVSVTEGEGVLVSRVRLIQGETEELPCGPSWGVQARTGQIIYSRFLLPIRLKKGRDAPGLLDLTLGELSMQSHLQGKAPQFPTMEVSALDTRSIWNPG